VEGNVHAASMACHLKIANGRAFQGRDRVHFSSASMSRLKLVGYSRQIERGGPEYHSICVFLLER
jgi:hypothetical protein